MLLRLTALEWRNLSGDRSALAVGLLLGLAVSYGAFNGSRWVAFQKSAIDAALHEERTRMEAIRAEMPRIASGEKKVSAY